MTAASTRPGSFDSIAASILPHEAATACTSRRIAGGPSLSLCSTGRPSLRPDLRPAGRRARPIGAAGPVPLGPNLKPASRRARDRQVRCAPPPAVACGQTRRPLRAARFEPWPGRRNGRSAEQRNRLRSTRLRAFAAAGQLDAVDEMAEDVQRSEAVAVCAAPARGYPTHIAAARGTRASLGASASPRGGAARATMRSSMTSEAARVVRLWSEPGITDSATFG